MPDILVIKDVPADQVDDKVRKFKRLGATDVEKTAQTGGTFTLRVTFPD
jgi:hypothetical protein